MTLDDRTEIMMMTISETIETKIKDVITEIGVIVMTIDEKIETIIDEGMLKTMTGESTIETDVIVMMTSEGKTGTEGIDETVTTMTDKTGITTILADVTEIAMPMLTGDVKTETEETITIVMMTCEGKTETGEIVTTMTDETEIMTILADVTEIAMPMWIGDVKTEIGETITIVMTT